MAGISKRMDKQGNIISYRIRVSRGRKIDGTMRKPFEMSWPDTKKGESIPSGWSQARIEKKVKEIAILFEEKCKKGNVIAEKWRFQEYADYVIDLKCESGNIKKSTKNRYKELLGRINDEDNDGIGHLYLDRITAADLNKLYKRLPIACHFNSSFPNALRIYFISSILKHSASFRGGRGAVAFFATLSLTKPSFSACSKTDDITL